MSTKRIVIVGDLRPHTRTSQRMRALARLGHAVVGISTVDVDTLAPAGERTGLVSRFRHRLGRPLDPTGANDALVRAVADTPIDVLWVDKAPSLRTTTLDGVLALRPDVRLAFFSEDDMTLAGNQSVWFRESLPLYDVVFTTKSHNARSDELPALGARRVQVVTKTFAPDVHRPLVTSRADRERLGARVGFVGTFEEHRARLLLALARAALPVRVWGNGWSAWKDRHPLIHVENRPVYGDDYVRALCATDVNLGFLRKASRDRHTDRSVEIPACGAFLLGERTDEHRALFEEGVEAEYFGDADELARKVRYFLDAHAERTRIAAAGRARCEASDYSHDAALARMLDALEEAATRRGERRRAG